MLTQMVARAAAADLMNALFGKGQGGNLAALATAIFGGFRAEGGPVSAGRAYIVGERGPELFVPRSSGTIEPNHKLRRSGDGVAITINVNATGGNADGFRSSARQMAVDISRRLARVRAVA
jgi:phage-related minor tail protein